MEFAWLSRWQPQLLAILRIVAALIYLEHGTAKLLMFPAPQPGIPYPLPTILMAAGAIEIVAGILMTFGLFTRLAAFIAAGEMAVGYWMVHAAKGPWPHVNGGDAPILFCFVFLYIAAAGPGAWSIDSARYTIGDDGTRNRAT